MVARSPFKFEIWQGTLPRGTMIIVIVVAVKKSGKVGTAILQVFLTELLCFVVLGFFNPLSWPWKRVDFRNNKIEN